VMRGWRASRRRRARAAARAAAAARVRYDYELPQLPSDLSHCASGDWIEHAIACCLQAAFSSG
jgi:hypothetical protein